MKTCSTCHIEKPLEDFSKNKRATLGYGCYCKLCQRIRDRAYYAINSEKKLLLTKKYYKNNRDLCSSKRKLYRSKNVEKLKNDKLKNNYNITLQEYNALFEKQNGKCAICGTNKYTTDYRTGKDRSLYIDHCHTTGIVRGLLCNACNLGLGKFKDSRELIVKTLNYLDGVSNLS